MTAAELLVAVNQYLRGLDDDAPTWGDDEASYWIDIANRKQQEWARDGKQQWASLFEVRTAGPVVAATQTYDLDAELILPADRVYVTTTDDQDVDFAIVKPTQRDELRAAYLSGRNPQKLTFTQDIETGQQIVGGTINVAGYYLPDLLADEDDVVAVDDPTWLALATASDIAYNDIIYEDRAEGLMVRANNLYSMMANNNRRGTYDNPRRLLVGNSYRIHGPTNRRSRNF